MALTIPAVQQARQSSRKLQCQNHLRQIGVAMANFESSEKAFPTASSPHTGHLRLMPYLDAGPLHDSLVALITPESWMVPVYGCPSDPVVWGSMRAVGDSSYYYNKGTKIDSPYNGFVRNSRYDIQTSDVRDGLSNTVAMSERLVRWQLDSLSPKQMERQPKRFFWWTKYRFRTEQEAIENCLNQRTTTYPQPFGVSMLNYQNTQFYDHLLTPNQHGCYNNVEDFEVDFSLTLTPASSLHNGGVNSLMGDGSVRFMNQSIDASVWQALGTRSSSDQIPSSF